MSAIKEIIMLFADLSPEEKTRCLNTLQFQAGSSQRVSAFSMRHQGIYKQCIKFIRTPPRKGDEHIEITVKTNFGNFTARGKTKDEAKLNAIILAEEQEYESISKGEELDKY